MMTSTPRWCGRTVSGLLVLVLTPVSARADDYSDKAVAKLNQLYAHGEKSFGFTMDETVTTSKGETLPFQFKYYTTPGRIYYQRLQFALPKKGGKRVLSSGLVFVNPGEDARAQQVDVAPKGDQIVTKNLAAKKQELLIGSIYEYQINGSSSPDNNTLTPPLRMLVCPCVDRSYHEFEPDQLGKLKAELVENSADVKGYEFKSGYNRFRLNFSPSRNDAVVKSELIINQGVEGVPPDRLTRTVDTWQELPGGRVVPARVTLAVERMGQPDDTVTREFSNVMIGDVPADRFDVSRQVEAGNRIIAVRDQQIEEGLLEANDYQGLHDYYKSTMVVPAAPAKDRRSRRLFLIASVAVLGIVAGLLVWRARARRSGPAGNP